MSLHAATCSALQAWGHRNLAQVQNVNQENRKKPPIGYLQACSSRAEDLVVPPWQQYAVFLPIFCPFSGLELMLKARLWPDPVSLGGDVRLSPPCFYDHCVRRSSRGRLLCLSDRGLLAQLPLKSKLWYLMREVPVSGICWKQRALSLSLTLSRFFLSYTHTC